MMIYRPKAVSGPQWQNRLKGPMHIFNIIFAHNNKIYNM